MSKEGGTLEERCKRAAEVVAKAGVTADDIREGLESFRRYVHARGVVVKPWYLSFPCSVRELKDLRNRMRDL